MKTSLLFLAAIAALFVFPAFSHAQGAPSIAVVDMSEVMKKYNRSITAEAELKGKAQKAQADIQGMVGDYTKMRDEALRLEQEVKAPGIAEAVRKAKVDEFTKKYTALKTFEQKLREFQQSRESLFRDETLRIRNEIITDINKAITTMGPTSGDLIFDKSAMAMSGTSVLLFASTGVRDITNDVIRKLNSAAPAAAPVGTTAPRPASPAGSTTAPRPRPVTP
ncbi:MAG: OmpH family outer membrane protein [Candidatus Methylacidiphilales bacterium]|nr:OmpH family outer membrane protein [Candidatus Methylacidiphilales bacterium]